MGKAFECDNCGGLYKEFKSAECISTDREEVNSVKIIAYQGSKQADICKKCMVTFALRIANHFEEE